MNMFRDIHDFHEKFKLPPMALDPGKIPPDVMEFRVKFMQEELDEFKEATATGNAEGQIDALVDLVYVAMGTAYLARFPFNSAWERVQRANMAKTRVLRAFDSKRESIYDVVKPPFWKPPVHTDLVENSLKQMKAFLTDIGEMDE